MKLLFLPFFLFHISLTASIESPFAHVQKYIDAEQKGDFKSVLKLIEQSTTSEFYESILKETGGETGLLELLKSTRKEYDAETQWITESQEEAARSVENFHPPFGNKKVPSNYQLIFYGDHENQSHIVFQKIDSGWVAIDPAKFYREVMK